MKINKIGFPYWIFEEYFQFLSQKNTVRNRSQFRLSDFVCETVAVSIFSTSRDQIVLSDWLTMVERAALHRHGSRGWKMTRRMAAGNEGKNRHRNESLGDPWGGYCRSFWQNNKVSTDCKSGLNIFTVISHGSSGLYANLTKVSRRGPV